MQKIVTGMKARGASNEDLLAYWKARKLITTAFVLSLFSIYFFGINIFTLIVVSFGFLIATASWIIGRDVDEINELIQNENFAKKQEAEKIEANRKREQKEMQKKEKKFLKDQLRRKNVETLTSNNDTRIYIRQPIYFTRSNYWEKMEQEKRRQDYINATAEAMHLANGEAGAAFVTKMFGANAGSGYLRGKYRNKK